MAEVVIRPAETGDLPALHAVVERAYRGDAARQGWTHEADLLAGARTDLETLEGIVSSPDERLLTAFEGEAPVGCVNVARRGEGLAYLGLLCVEPARQADGLGRRLIDAAERAAVELFGADRIEMTVIEFRGELIAYYERRGFRLTGERRPFPVTVDPPLALVVLEKVLSPTT